MKRGYVREGEGTEYQSDEKRALYLGGFKNGKRDGFGTEFKGFGPLYIGGWKNGLRHGKGKEYDESENVIIDGEWIDGKLGSVPASNESQNDSFNEEIQNDSFNEDIPSS